MGTRQGDRQAAAGFVRMDRILTCRKILGAVLEVEVVDALGGEERTTLLVGRRGHGGDQLAGARPGDHVEVVRDPRVRPVLVHLLRTHTQSSS